MSSDAASAAPAAAAAAPAAPVESAADISSKLEKVQKRFGELSIEWRVTKHEPVPTVEAFRASAAGALSGLGAKNLFLKDKKKQLWLLVAANDAPVNLGALTKSLGIAGGPMRMEGADALLATLGVLPGAVTPLAVINDTKTAVKVLLDSKLDTAEFINVHPLTNTATVQVTPAELRKLFAATGHECKVVDLAALAAEEGGAAAPAAGAAGGAKPAKPAKEAKPAKPAAGAAAAAAAAGNQGGIQAKKLTDFHNWYSEVVIKSELIEYYDISGCYVRK